MQSWSDGLPTSTIHLHINVWFPTWLASEKQQTDSYTYVDHVVH